MKNLPNDLLEVIKQGLDGYKLKVVYSLKLSHELMGYFPAISVFKDKRTIILTDDPSVLKDVWKLLQARPSQIEKRLFYVNEKEGYGFDVVFEYGGGELKQIPADQIITREVFEDLELNVNHSFEWASGLLGPDWSQERFLSEIDKAVNAL